LSAGQRVEIQPGGRRARIRGLHSHGEAVEEVPPGTRVAANLTGIGTDELQRGHVLSLPGAQVPTQLLDARLRMLTDAGKPLGHNVEVQVSSGAARVTGRTRILGAREVAPGEEGWAQLVLDRPVVVHAGDRFIIRLPSPGVTLGGGQVVDPHPRRRHPRFRPATTERLRRLAEGEPAAVLDVRLRELGPVMEKELIRVSGLRREAGVTALDAAIASGQFVVLDRNEGSRLVATRYEWERWARRLSGVLESYHSRHPLREAAPREEVRSRLRMNQDAFDGVVRRAAAEGILREEGSGLASPDHQVALSADQERAVERLLERFRASPYSPPSLAQCEEAVGAEVVRTLLKAGSLIRVSDEIVFSDDAYKEMVEGIVSRIQDDGPITVAEVRDLLGTTRRYTVALLEHLDEKRITRRVGDERVLR
ncbi:MAG: SelB C-terminal domain-containing protein, partial [Anaerolineae bacterium]